MAHRIRRRAERSDRGCRPLAEPEQRQSQFDHASRGDRGADRSAGRRSSRCSRRFASATHWWSSACARMPGLQAAQCTRRARFTHFPTCQSCSAPGSAASRSPTAIRSRRFAARRGARLAGRRQRLRRAGTRQALVRHFDQESERGIRSHRAGCREAQALERWPSARSCAPISGAFRLPRL